MDEDFAALTQVTFTDYIFTNFYHRYNQLIRNNQAAVEEAEDEAPELEDNSGIDVLESSSSDGDFEDDEEGS